MQAKKPLSDTLNLRVDEQLAREIERIAEAGKTTTSEVARRLLEYGARVQRKLEAQRLSADFRLEQQGIWDNEGWIEIDARWVSAEHGDPAKMSVADYPDLWIPRSPEEARGGSTGDGGNDGEPEA